MRQFKEFYTTDIFDNMSEVKFGKFIVENTFNVGTGSLAQSSTLKPGLIPRITASSKNNGIIGMYSEDDRFVYAENAVTTTFLGDSFYHSGRVSLDMKVHFLTHEKMTDNIGMYISGVLSKFKPYYSYGNQLSSSKLKLLKLSLPMIDSETPDWDYMDSYIESMKLKFIESKIEHKDNLKENLESLLDNKQKHELEDVEFGEFLLEDVFVVSGTKSIDRSKVVQNKGGVNFIGRTISNNGVQSQIERLGYPPNEPNTITASVVGVYKYVTYQLEEYYCSQNINKLSIKGDVEVSLNAIQYLMSHIQKFVDKWRGEFGGYTINEMKKHAIHIPITSSGAPNWDYMDKYIHNIKIDKINMINSELEYEIENLSAL